MKRELIILLALALPLGAQTQGNLPTPVDAAIADAPSGQTGNPAQTTTPENISQGDTIFFGLAQSNISTNTACPNTGFTMSDSLSNTWTPYAVVNMPHGNNTKMGIQLFCAVNSHAGTSSDTISFTNPDTVDSCNYATLYARVPAFLGLTCTADGSEQSNQFDGTGGAGTNSLSNTNTTTVNGDAIFTLAVCSGCQNSNANELTGANIQTIAMNTGAGLSLGLYLLNAGAPGSYTSTITGQNGHQGWLMGTVALEPAALAITTTALADCAVGQPCNEYLEAVGGTGSYSWGMLSGSVPGMTLASNGQFTDTGSGPTSAGVYTLVFQVTSGSTVVQKTLNLLVASSFLTPSVIQSGGGAFTNGGATVSPFGTSSSCNDHVLVFLGQADDTHGNEGWKQALSGSGNFYSATVGGTAVPVQTMPQYGGDFRGPDYALLFGPLPNAGTFTISGFNNQGASSGGFLAYEVSNVQDKFDLPVFTGEAVTSDGTISTTISTLAPNEMLLNATYGLEGDTGAYSSPFTLDNQITGHALISSVSSQTATVTMTSHSGCSPNCINMYSSYTVGLRPATNLSVCPSKAPRHRTDLK